jgi:hypothetical protein
VQLGLHEFLFLHSPSQQRTVLGRRNDKTQSAQVFTRDFEALRLPRTGRDRTRLRLRGNTVDLRGSQVGDRRGGVQDASSPTSSRGEGSGLSATRIRPSLTPRRTLSPALRPGPAGLFFSPEPCLHARTTG